MAEALEHGDRAGLKDDLGGLSLRVVYRGRVPEDAGEVGRARGVRAAPPGLPAAWAVGAADQPL